MGLEAFSPTLRERFGAGVPELTAIVPVVLVSLGASSYFNAGAWLIGTVMAFAFVGGVIHKQVSRSVPWMLVACLLWLVLAGGGLVSVWEPVKTLLPPEFEFVKLASFFIGIYVALPIAVVALSVRKQDGKSYPEALQRAIDRQLVLAPAYKTNVEYDVSMSVVRDTVRLDIIYSYTVHNRMTSAQTWRGHIPTRKDRENRFELAQLTIDGREQGLSTYGKDGRYELSLSPGAGREVVVRFTLEYELTDAELFTVFEPATDLAVRIRRPPSSLDLQIRPQYEPSLVESPPASPVGDLGATIATGVLPYQGVQLLWSPKPKQLT